MTDAYAATSVTSLQSDNTRSKYYCYATLYITVTTAPSQSLGCFPLAQLVLHLFSSSFCSEKEHLGDNACRYFTGWMPFLSPTKSGKLETQNADSSQAHPVWINQCFLMDEALLSLRQFYDIGTLTAKAVYCDCLTQILIHFLQTGDITLHNETKSYGHVQRLLDQQLKPWTWSLNKAEEHEAWNNDIRWAHLPKH